MATKMGSALAGNDDIVDNLDLFYLLRQKRYNLEKYVKKS